jgi:hypothetical protein
VWRANHSNPAGGSPVDATYKWSDHLKSMQEHNLASLRREPALTCRCDIKI